MNIYDLKGLLSELWATPGVSTIVYAVVLNMLLALAVAIKEQTFTLSRLGDFMSQQIIPYVTVYVAAQFLGEGAGYSWLGTAAYALVLAKVGASTAEKLYKLGVPIPPSIMNLINPMVNYQLRASQMVDERVIEFTPLKTETTLGSPVKVATTGWEWTGKQGAALTPQPRNLWPEDYALRSTGGDAEPKG